MVSKLNSLLLGQNFLSFKCEEPQVNHKLAWYLAWGYQCFTRLKLYSCKQGFEKQILEKQKWHVKHTTNCTHMHVNSDHSTKNWKFLLFLRHS